MSEKQPEARRTHKWPRWLVGLGVICAGIGAALMLSSYTNKPDQFNGGFYLAIAGSLTAVAAAITQTIRSGRNGHNNS